MKKIIGRILILMGLLLIFSAFYTKYKVYKNQQYMINAFEKTIENVDKENKEDSSKLKVSEKEPEGTIGIISIPKINLKAAISEGIENETLKYAIGHFPGTPIPDKKGNFCIAGHRSYTYGEFFNRLDELEIGDEILITTKVNSFKYKVYEKKVVEPSEVSVLNNTKDSIITLVTCTPVRVATHRLIVKGKLQ